MGLESITTLQMEPPSIVLYGGRGVGKTTLALSAPKPILVSTEKVGYFPGVSAFPQADSFEAVMDNMRALATEDHDFETLVVDSLDWLQTLVYRHLIKERPTDEKGRSVRDVEDYGYGKGFAHALDYWNKYLSAVEYLREKKGMAVIQIAHTEVKRFDDPTSDSYDRYQIKLQKLASERVQEGVDAVFFLKAMHATTKEQVGFNNEKTRAIGGGERIAYTDARPAFDAKSRFDMPDEITIPQENGFAALAKHIPYYNQANESE